MRNKGQQTLQEIIQTKSGVSLSCLRILVGWIFFTAGMGKLFGLSHFGGWAVSKSYFQQIGILPPEVMIFIVGFLEFIGGFFLLIGIFTRIATFPFLITMAVALLTVHKGEGAMYPCLLWISCIVLLEHGGGKFSIDHYLTKKK